VVCAKTEVIGAMSGTNVWQGACVAGHASGTPKRLGSGRMCAVWEQGHQEDQDVRRDVATSGRADLCERKESRGVGLGFRLATVKRMSRNGKTIQEQRLWRWLVIELCPDLFKLPE